MLSVFLLAQWGLAFASILSLLLPFALLGGIVWAIASRRWASSIVLLAASPLAFSFVLGLFAYGRADAHMRGVGLSRGSSSFIDRHTRLPTSSSGCFVDGDEWVWDAPNNAALHLLTSIAGPPSGTYDGPIPTEEEARGALEGASPLDWRALRRDEVRVDGRRVVLQRWLGWALLEAEYFDLSPDAGDSPLGPDGRIVARLWQGRVLLIEVRDALRIPGSASHVAVIDARSGRLLGHFAGTWSMSMDYPRAWHPVRPPLHARREASR